MISSYLYSTERSLLALNISVLRSIIVNAAVILILPYVFGESIIWFSLLIYEVIVLIIAVALLKHSEKNGVIFFQNHIGAASNHNTIPLRCKSFNDFLLLNSNRYSLFCNRVWGHSETTAYCPGICGLQIF